MRRAEQAGQRQRTAPPDDHVGSDQWHAWVVEEPVQQSRRDVEWRIAHHLERAARKRHRERVCTQDRHVGLLPEAVGEPSRKPDVELHRDDAAGAKGQLLCQASVACAEFDDEVLGAHSGSFHDGCGNGRIPEEVLCSRRSSRTP